MLVGLKVGKGEGIGDGGLDGVEPIVEGGGPPSSLLGGGGGPPPVL